MMGIYEDFAFFYKNGHYPKFSARMFELLPGVLELFNAKPVTILDLACGEGTFAAAMAQKGYNVTGVDTSEKMLQYARKRAKEKKVNVIIGNQDIRFLPFSEEFDLVTCWFDSLNYLLELDDLQNTFNGVHRALKDGGLFIFDLNTIHGLAINWQRHPCSVQADGTGIFEVLRPGYDYERNIATLQVTGFVEEENGWRRMDEEHQERGFTLEEIGDCLREAGLQRLACWGSFEEKSEPEPDSGRVWFVTGK
jgi:SAM-dependent methyltransferase